MSDKTKEPLLQKGTVLNGKWEILEHIATGGKGEVYRARQINLDREVVVKTISEEFLASFEGDQEEIQAEIERFRREVKTMAQVRHPNVLQVFDHDQGLLEREGQKLPVEYIVMEYIPGPTLRSTMPEEGFGKDETAICDWIRKYLFPILDGVETIHGLGIVHRDLKPTNVIVDGSTPKIMDFGLAGGKRWHEVTRSHHVIGTIPYMASEQFLDLAGTDFRGDVYSLGKILYEAVSGKMGKDTSFPFKTVHLPYRDTPFLKRLDHIVQHATAEERNQRLASVKVLREALQDLLGLVEAPSGAPGRALWRGLRGRRLWYLVSLVVMVVAGSVAFHMWYHRGKSVTPVSSSPFPFAEKEKAHPPEAVKPMPREGLTEAPTPQTLKGKDGATLHLVPAGEVTLTARSGPQATRTAKVEAFYMDETLVTNHQYYEFLNQALSRIRVEGGVVLGDGQAWFMLGEVVEGYEPIVFHNGRFHMSDSAHAACPVLRVTAYGAEAYARHYGRRLPTEAEWLRAAGGNIRQSRAFPVSLLASLGATEAHAQQGRMHEMPPDSIQRVGPPTPIRPDGHIPPPRQVTPAGTPSPAAPPVSAQAPHSAPRSHGPSRMPVPVLTFPPNALGLRGLGGEVSEWVVRGQRPSYQGAGETEFAVLPMGVGRHPWEAFEEVGFRCALGAGIG